MIWPIVLLLAETKGTLEYFQTTRVDVRMNEPYPVAPQPPPREIAVAYDALFQPTVRVRLNVDRHWDYVFTYNPSLSITDIELSNESQPVALNAGSASVMWHDHRVRVMVTEAATYGWQNLAYLYGTPIAGQAQAPGQTTGNTGTGTGTGTPGTPATPGTPTTAAPTPTPGQTQSAPLVPITTFPFGSTNTNAMVAVQTTREWNVAVNGGYTVSGNLAGDPRVTAVYPEQFGPNGRVAATYQASVRDAFLTVASGTVLTTPQATCVTGKNTGLATCRYVAPVILVQETARHMLSRTSTLAFSAGASASVFQLANGGSVWGIAPVGSVSYIERLGPPPKDARDLIEASSLQLSASLASEVNIFSGTPSNRAVLTAALVEHMTPDLSVRFVAGATQTVDLPHPDPAPLTLFNGGVEARVRLVRGVTASVGVQGFYSDQQNVGVLPTTATAPTTTGAEVGYFALTVRPPTLRF